MKNISNYLAIGLSSLIVVINGIAGHYFAPNGILYTPIVLTVTTLLIVFGTKNLKINNISFLTYFFVALNDFLIKLYSGGTHDNEGLGWINALLFIGLVPTLLILFIGIFNRKEESVKNKFIAIGIFIICICLHLGLFSQLGY